jgi:hypothetical protein
MAIDEPNHLLRGVRPLQTGDFSLSYAHPPLANVISAVPVAFTARRAFPPILLQPPGSKSALQQLAETPGLFALATAWVWRYLDNPNAQLAKARLMNLVFLVLMAVVVAAWSQALWGCWGGVLSMTLVSCTPLSIAMAYFVGNDLAAAAMGIVLLFVSFRYWVRPSALMAILVGTLGGAAVTTKYSLVTFLPVAALALLGSRLLVTEGTGERSDRVTGLQFTKKAGQRTLLDIALAACFGVLEIWTSYGFTNGISFVPAFQSPWLAAASPVLPNLFLLGLDRNIEYASVGYVSFLFGDAYVGGRWLYFPLTYIVKTPLPEILLVLAGGVLAVRMLWTWRRSRVGVAALATLGIGGLLYGSSLLTSQLDIGFRHALPLLPILAVMAGAVTGVGSRWKVAVVGPLIAWAIAEAVLSHPHQLSYCNQLAGGTAGCHRYVGDSSIDWFGQDLGRVAAFQRTHQTGPMYVSRYIFTYPSVYGIEAYNIVRPEVFGRALMTGMLRWVVVPKPALQTPGIFPERDSLCELLRYEPVPFEGKGMWMFEIVPERLRAPTPMAEIDACHARGRVVLPEKRWN